ncbi:MAG: Nif3-like dinuclear metal center hexameric protein [Synergistaceae bacterium]|nr:Nif3-like dinuclear metal center hexameric protein [Synergistaceae bacterium]
MKVRELVQHIDSFAPFELCEEWDNSGLLVGDNDSDVTRIGVCLDAVTCAVTEAHKRGCNVLVTHHPLIFRPLKRITASTEQGRTILEAARLNVSVIAAHTNWDKAYGGVNDTLAALLGLNDCESLGDFGLCGILGESMRTEDFAHHVRESWGLSRLDVYASAMPERVSRVALCGGAGSEFWTAAKSMGADVYITADMKYHELSDAVNDGMTIALACHGEMERASIPELARKISACGIDTEIIGVNALSEPIRV